MDTYIYIVCVYITIFYPSSFTDGYRIYQDVIPNGDLVPHPCKPNYLWQGVGHLVPGGGGKRNPFGVDLYRNGKKWDRCLCEADSDGDGKTNGEELGDPDCTWTPGTVPKVTTGLSHPGICEPLDSSECRDKTAELGNICDYEETASPCLKKVQSERRMKTWKVQFTNTSVPPVETTYMCQRFAVPDGKKDYHAVAFQPIINNKLVMHHILLFGCTSQVGIDSAPWVCGMVEDPCRELIFGWTVGGAESCIDEDFGFKIGRNGYKSLMMQIHWNNPGKLEGLTDNSGVLVYITPKLRGNDGGIMMIGQLYITIPGSRRRVVTDGKCTSDCTTSYSQSLHLVASTIHMHYLGREGYIEHMREGKVINTLVSQDKFSYDSPITYQHIPAVIFRPGDELKTVCHHRSTSRSYTTYYGDGTRDEMCLGFITYYTAIPQASGCLQFRSTSLCHRPDSVAASAFLGCDFDNFVGRAERIFNDIYSVCDRTGKTCLNDCDVKIKQYRERDACLAGDAYYYVRWWARQKYGSIGVMLNNILQSCDVPDTVDAPPTAEGREPNRTNPAEYLCPLKVDETTYSDMTSYTSTLSIQTSYHTTHGALTTYQTTQASDSGVEESPTTNVPQTIIIHTKVPYNMFTQTSESKVLTDTKTSRFDGNLRTMNTGATENKDILTAVITSKRVPRKYKTSVKDRLYSRSDKNDDINDIFKVATATNNEFLTNNLAQDLATASQLSTADLKDPSQTNSALFLCINYDKHLLLLWMIFIYIAWC